jgi:hypothetical protein
MRQEGALGRTKEVEMLKRAMTIIIHISVGVLTRERTARAS